MADGTNGPPTKKPPPPTTAGASTKKPVQSCQQSLVNPCSVDKLVIDVLAKDDNFTGEGTEGGRKLSPGKRKDVVRKFDLTKLRTREPITGITSRETLDLLKAYDLVIETLADYPSGDALKPKSPEKADDDDVVTIRTIRAHYHGRACSLHLHPALFVIPLHDSVPELPKLFALHKPGADQLAYAGPRKFYAPIVPWDAVPIGTGLFAAFEIVLSLFKATKPKELLVWAFACGVRAEADKQPGIANLCALLRIYRRDRWAIGVKIPPLGSFKDESSATSFKSLWSDVPSGDYKRERTVGIGGPGVFESTHTSERQGKKTTETDELWLLGAGAREQISKKSKGQGRFDQNTYRTSTPLGTTADGKPVYGMTETRAGKVYQERGHAKKSSELISERLAAASGFELVLMHNDREVDIAKMFGLATDTVTALKNSINKFAATVAKIKDFFKKLPQAGWKFTFEVSVFAGTFLLEWRPTYAAPLANERYWPVNYSFRGRIEMEIVHLTLRLSFGVEAQALESGLVLKVEGSIELKVKVAHDINMDLLKTREKFDLKSECKLDIHVVGYVNLFGKTLAGAKLGVTTAIELVGYLAIDWKLPECGIKGSLDLKPTYLYGYVEGLLWNSNIDPIELLPGHELYKFT